VARFGIGREGESAGHRAVLRDRDRPLGLAEAEGGESARPLGLGEEAAVRVCAGQVLRAHLASCVAPLLKTSRLQAALSTCAARAGAAHSSSSALASGTVPVHPPTERWEDNQWSASSRGCSDARPPSGGGHPQGLLELEQVRPGADG